MKLLIAIMTCHRLDYFIDDCTVDYLNQRGWRDLDQQKRVNTIRQTWVKDIPRTLPTYPNPGADYLATDYKFFYGTKLRDAKPNQRVRDKVTLRDALPDEVYLDCNDGYKDNPEKMKAICHWALGHGYDFILRCDDDTFIYPDRLLATNWAQHDYVGAGKEQFHPGGCIFLSRRAMELIVDGAPTTYADDVWIGKLLTDHGIAVTNEPTMHNKWGEGYVVRPESLPIEQLSSFHSCKPDAMRYLYEHRQV